MLTGRRIRLEIEDGDLVSHHGDEIDVAGKELPAPQGSRDSILELKLGSRSAEEAFRAKGVKGARHVVRGFLEMLDQAEPFGGVPDSLGNDDLGVPQHQANRLVDDGAEHRTETPRSWLARRWWDRPFFLFAER